METTDESRTEIANFSLEESVGLGNITPMPKHVFLNTLPGHLAPFQTIPRSRYDTDRTKQEFYGQESSLNSFITTHCRSHNSISANGGSNDNRQQRSPCLQEVQSANNSNDSMLKRNQCSVCTRILANPASLKQHMRLHLGEKPFKCRYCDKTSATMCNILTHERTHTNERPYKCLVCAADFSSSSNLKTHMRIHSGDRPFRCNICDRRFVTSNALTTHLRVHWGLRLHPCPLCDRQFSTSSNLRVHHRTVHLGIKQYQCSVCGRAFATSSNLNAHSRQHPESAYIVKYSPPSPSTSTTILSQSHPTQSLPSYPTVSMTGTNANTNSNIDIESTPSNHHPILITPAIQHQGITIMAPVEVNVSLPEEQDESNSVVDLLTSTSTASYNPTSSLMPVALGPSPAVRKTAKVSVYCPSDIETAPSSFQQQQQQPAKSPPDDAS